jgi:hypothetical protein
MRFHPAAILPVVAIAAALAATSVDAAPKDEVKGAFTRFVKAQNAHDLAQIENLLADAPDFLWISPGHVVRERGAALDLLRELFKGKWRVDPDWSTFQILGLDFTTMEIFVNVSMFNGTPRKARMNLILVDTGHGWRVLNVLVSELPG